MSSWEIYEFFNPAQDGPIWGFSRMGVGQKDSPSLNLSRISYNDETWHSYALPKEHTKKHINHVTHLLSSADISIF